MSVADTTFTLRPALDRDPPFDDELDPGAPGAPSPLQPPLPFPPLHPPVRHRPPCIPRSVQRAAVGDPDRFARRLLLGVVEVAARRRPIRQLRDMVSPSVAVDLGNDLTPACADPHRLCGAAVATVRCSEPNDGIAEVCATIRTPTRVHAAAMRLEIRRDQWVCTQLMIG